MVQPHQGRLPELACGQFRYVVAQNGLFLQARTNCLAASVRLTDFATNPANPQGLPYGEAREGLCYVHGPLGSSQYQQLLSIALAAAPQETATYIVYDPTTEDYRLRPVHTRSVSDTHITQDTLAEAEAEHLFIHCHTHGYGESYFSSQDDAADRSGGDGIYIAVVLGHCRSGASITAVARLVVYGWLIPLPVLPWEVKDQ